MKYEEIENAVKCIDSVCEDRQFDIGCSVKCDTDGRDCFIKIVKEALEKQNKYRWHDLRKNPDDLPNENDFVLVCFDPYFDVAYTTCMVDSDFWKLHRIVAWREIEPFKEVEE